MKMKEYLNPKLDVVFRMIFADERNADILGDFLIAVLRIPREDVSEITVLDPTVALDMPNEKKSILDLKVILKSGRLVNVEIQIRNDAGMIPRLHYYKSRLVTGQVMSGKSYLTLAPVSCVAIVDYSIYEDEKCHHRFRFYDTENEIEFSGYEEIHIIELPKADRCAGNPGLYDWIRFLNAKSKEEFDMLAEKNETVKKAVGVLAKLSADEASRMLAEAREKEVMDQMSRELIAKEDGKLEGKLETAQNLLRMGFSLADISKATGLSESELGQIKQ